MMTVRGLRHPDPFVRVRAIASLAGWPDADRILLDALGDEYPQVRREAVRALAEIGSDLAARALSEVVTKDPSTEVREEAVDGLWVLLSRDLSGRASSAS